MKKINRFALIVAAFAAVFSCQKAVEEEIVEPEKNKEPVEEVTTPSLKTYTCSIVSDESKVTVDQGGKTAWEDGDVIVIHGHKVNQNVEVALHDFSNENKVATFSADLSGVRGVDDVEGAYYVSYPASAYIGLSGSDEGYNGYYSGFGNTNLPLMAGYLDGVNNEFKMYNLCGVMTFKVTGDYNGYIFEGNRAETVGYDGYRVKITKDTEDYQSWKTEAPKASVTGTVNGDGATLNYIFFPNGASFPNGFTLYLMKDGVIKGYVTSTKSISVARGHQKNMGLLPSGKIHARAMTLSAANAVDLNNFGGAKQTPANSYLLVRNSTYRDKVFKIWAVKGNDLSQPLDDIASVEVLWESRCQGSGADANILINAVDFDKNHIYFQTPAGDNFKDGNAVIAAKDALGNILWSWHIWVSNTEVGTISCPEVSATAVMDRNLGAMKVSTIDAVSDIMSYGLLYQWGRKDPILGAKYVESGSLPGYSSSSSFSLLNTQMTLDYSIQNPMVFTYVNDSSDWCSTSDNYWDESVKTIYDPCPSGYRVMKRNTSVALWSDANTADLTKIVGWDIQSANYSFAVGSPATVFPLAGYKDGNLTTSYPGKRAAIWSSKGSDASGYFINIRSDKTTYTRTSSCKARAYSVRCVAE